jgi:hypothetical protein
VTEGPFGRRPTEPAAPRDRPPAPPPAPPARLAANATWIAGVLAVLIIAYITLNTIRTEGPGGRGVAAGKALPPFAMPLAGSDLEGDSNVSRVPGEGAAHAACEVRGAKVLNSCELAEQGPVALVFFAEPSEDCKRQVDVLDRVVRDFPNVRAGAVSIRGDRDKVREAIRERGWRLPVGYDRDGAVANAYAVGICPTITFARRGGKVASTSYSFLDETALARRLRGL